MIKDKQFGICAAMLSLILHSSMFPRVDWPNIWFSNRVLQIYCARGLQFVRWVVRGGSGDCDHYNHRVILSPNQLWPYLDLEVLFTVTHALDTFPIDYYNPLNMCLPLKTIQKFQLVQSAMTCVVIGTSCLPYKIPVLRDALGNNLLLSTIQRSSCYL